MTEEEFMRNLPAFPHEHRFGMTLRDYFAAKAMASMLLAASTTENMALLITEKARTNNFDVTAEEWISESAYAVADAMLKARQA